MGSKGMRLYSDQLMGPMASRTSYLSIPFSNPIEKLRIGGDAGQIDLAKAVARFSGIDAKFQESGHHKWIGDGKANLLIT